MSYTSDVGEFQGLHKRKRLMDDAGGMGLHSERIPQPPPPPHSEKLDLIRGDADTFCDVLQLINSYKGVLNRHESLAANLGAKLTGPRLLRAMEGMFEGPIITTPPPPFDHCPVSWFDIVQFAKLNPDKFHLTTGHDGERSCRFFLHGYQVQIFEDDWRLIVNGSVDRLAITSAPLEEDENAELATIEIVEARLQTLIKKADEVARLARQLNYQVSGRKAAINSRHPEFRSSSNTPQLHGGPGAGYDLRSDLLQQFQSQPSRQPLTRRSSLGVNNVESTHDSQMARQGDTTRHASHGMRPSRSPLSSTSASMPQEFSDASTSHRYQITSRIERLGKGEQIYPPCDRCRRLKVSCVKHLTACQGCTKKHGKCSWSAVTEQEKAWLDEKGEIGPDGPVLSGSDGEVHQATGSRFDPMRDEHRKSDYKPICSPRPNSEGSRPSSRENHRVPLPLAPLDAGPSGPLTQADMIHMESGSRRLAVRPESELEHRRSEGQHQEPQGEHPHLSRLASVASTVANARDTENLEASTRTSN